MSTVDWATKRPRPDHSRWLVPLLVVLIALVFVGVGVAMARPSAAPAAAPAPMVTNTPSPSPTPTVAPNRHPRFEVFRMPDGQNLYAMCDGHGHRVWRMQDSTDLRIQLDRSCPGAPR